MNQQQWHEWRARGIGGSDAPIVMGVSPFKTINQLWEEKVLGKKQPDNPAMARGRALEPLALDYFMAETGYLMETQIMRKHPELDWMRATLDGLNDEEEVLLEIKSCKECHETVPEHYYPQLQHQMEVVGYDKMFYLSFDGKEGKILEVHKDEAYVKEMIAKEKEFWQRVQEGLIDMSDDKNWEEMVTRYLELTREEEVMKSGIKSVQDEKEFLKSQFILASDGKPASGHGLILQRRSRKGRIDYGQIPALMEIDLEIYRKPDAPYWHVALDAKPEEMLEEN